MRSSDTANAMAWRNGRLATLGLALIGLAVSSLCAELYRYQDERGVTVVDWAIPAAYVTNGYEVLNELGQVVRVVQPAKTEAELEQEAARTRVQAAEAALAGRLAVADPADHYEEETIAALKAELKSLDEAVAGDVISLQPLKLPTHAIWNDLWSWKTSWHCASS